MNGQIKSGTWTEKDKEKVVEFLNFIANRATFKDITVKQNIEFFHLLTWMQRTLIPKIESTVFEVVAVHEAEPEPEPKSKSRKKK